MTHYLSSLWEILINIFETGTLYFFINSILTKKDLSCWKLKITMLLFLRFLCVTIGNAIGLIPIYTIIIAYLFNIITAIKMYREKHIICFFWGSVQVLLGISSEIISMLLLNTFTSMLPNEILFGEAYRFPSTTLYIIILVALCFIVSTTVTPNTLFSTKQKFFIFFTMIVGIMLTHCFMYIMVALEANQSIFLDIIILANVIFVCFFVSLLVYIYQLALQQQKNKELQERTRLLELETIQYNNLVNTTESLRAIKHDIHHHLSTIQMLIENDETAQLKQYLNEYKKHFDLDYVTSTTGNLVIDSIISTKTLIAKQEHTQLEFSIMLPECIPFTDVSLSSLLGNLFDNALEACKRLPMEKKRWITFEMKAQEDMLVIHIENSFDGIIEDTTSNSFLSRKKEANHGFGLKRINTLVEESNGFTEIRHTDNTFTVHIMVPLEKTNEF